jgi:hypothetical protein
MANKTKTSGTCQACFGSFALKGEKMVHHGYKRPGVGYIVGDCWGVGHLPYELDVEVTKSWRTRLADVARPNLLHSAETVKTATELVYFKTDYDAPYNHRTGVRPRKAYNVVKGVEPVDYYNTFEIVQNRELKRLEGQIEEVENAIKELDRRIAAWVYAPEKLVKTERKGPLVHQLRDGSNRSAACRLSYAGNTHLITTKVPSQVTCPRCLARKAEVV